MKNVEISSLREGMGLNKAQFGRLLGVDGAQVTRWENGESRPTKARMEKLKRLRDEHSGVGVVKDGQETDYSKPGAMENEAAKCRSISRTYYAKLSKAENARVDIRVSQLIYAAWTEEITRPKEKKE